MCTFFLCFFVPATDLIFMKNNLHCMKWILPWILLYMQKTKWNFLISFTWTREALDKVLKHDEEKYCFFFYSKKYKKLDVCIAFENFSCIFKYLHEFLSDFNAHTLLFSGFPQTFFFFKNFWNLVCLFSRKSC